MSVFITISITSPCFALTRRCCFSSSSHPSSRIAHLPSPLPFPFLHTYRISRIRVSTTRITLNLVMFNSTKDFMGKPAPPGYVPGLGRG